MGSIRALFLSGFKAQLAGCRGLNAEGGIRLRVWNHVHHLGQAQSGGHVQDHVNLRLAKMFSPATCMYEPGSEGSAKRAGGKK
jgi:hypothetical protein